MEKDLQTMITDANAQFAEIDPVESIAKALWMTERYTVAADNQWQIDQREKLWEKLHEEDESATFYGADVIRGKNHYRTLADVAIKVLQGKTPWVIGD